MIDVAIARIYNFASGVQKLRPLEDIPDKLSSQNEEITNFRKYWGMSLRKEMFFLAREELGTSRTRSSTQFQKINPSERGYYNLGYNSSK